ncbi:hypothetical protein LAZ67_20002192 [Cordylochernes scorpioides]|uniref:Peptidase aspartic putative domain-containing protein n=1 Tax=Cordylochernes scorpioides TaxID=51811 RepID=A0ABY6LKL6_9ARAC|nr:hypothetical protein LAZ67_20002192 [Cordylochernes scorpioides]
MSFLRAEVKAQQRINFSRIGVGENNPKYNFPSRPLHFNKNNGPRAAQLMVSRNENSKGTFLSPNYERKTKCIFCDGMGHENWKCFKIGRMTLEEQLKKMSDAGVCFKCLKRNHLRRHCRTKFICQNCGGPHYLNFCRGNNSRRDSFSENGGSSKERKGNSSVQNQKSTVLLTQSCASEILLMTVRANICSSETSKIINVLLDSGSQYSFIRESLAEELGLEKLGERKLTKCLFGGRQTREEKHSLYSFSITNILKEETVQQELGCGISTKKGVTIIRRKNVETSEIDLLMGADNLSKIWTDQMVCLEDGLTAINTKIGWSIFGEISLEEGLASEYVSPVFLTMSYKVKDLWDLEMLGVRDPVENISQEEKAQVEKKSVVEENEKTQVEKKSVVEESEKAQVEKKSVVEESEKAQVGKKYFVEESEKSQVEKKSVVETEESHKAEVEKKFVEADENGKAEIDKRSVIETESAEPLTKEEDFIAIVEWSLKVLQNLKMIRRFWDPCGDMCIFFHSFLLLNSCSTAGGVCYDY